MKKCMSIEKKITSQSMLLIIGIVSFLFLGIFSYYTSPFTSCDNGADAAFFRLVGQGITKGYLPYRDFFDMKGPFLFFIEYIGQVISYGRHGIFIVQWFNLFLVLWIITAIYDHYNVTNNFFRLGLMLPILYIASFTFEGGNLTEEFSLVPLFSCLYICIQFFENSDNPGDFWQKKVFWYAGVWFGICFGLLVMIRMTNAALICAIAIVIMIDLLKGNKIRQFIICIVMFLAGFIVSLVPAFLFYAGNGLLNDMVNAVFVLGFKYSGEKTFAEHLMETLLGERKQQALLVIVPAFIPLILRWRSWRERLLALLGALFSFFAIVSGNNYTHYYTLTLPLLVLCEVAVIDSADVCTKKRNVIAVSFMVIMLISQITIMVDGLRLTFIHLFQPYKFTTGQFVTDISSKIPEEDSRSVFCYNINPSWYTYADLFPCIKYCGWQEHYISLMPEIYNDLEKNFSENPPAWLVLPQEQGNLPVFIEEMLGASCMI